MFFKEIEIKNFRNYEQQNILFDRKINIFLGENAQGKTNLLESLFIMGLGKSFRTNRDEEMIGFGKDFCSVKTVIAEENESTQQSLKITYSKDGKKAELNSLKLKKNIDLIGIVYIVVFSPEDLKIIKEGPEKRRNFLDREICQINPVYYSNLARYKKILKQRNFLLKKRNINQNVLETFDVALSDYGIRIVEERERFVKRIEKISVELHQKISSGKEQISLFYETSIPKQNDTKERKNFFVEQLKKNVENDLKRGYTGIGPHRDDLKININELDIRQFGSQGQQRTAALSIKLAEINLIKEETGKKAVLLLDDVLSELDEKRQQFLIEAMNNVQVFITATEIEKSILEKIPEGLVFNVKEGIVKRLT